MRANVGDNMQSVGDNTQGVGDNICKVCAIICKVCALVHKVWMAICVIGHVTSLEQVITEYLWGLLYFFSCCYCSCFVVYNVFVTTY